MFISTYPFVLSWSMLEAMSCGCAVIGSRTAPVQEIIEDGHNGLLTDFFDPQALAQTVDRVLSDSALRHRLGQQARTSVIERYDLRSVCLPAYVERLSSLTGTG